MICREKLIPRSEKLPSGMAMPSGVGVPPIDSATAMSRPPVTTKGIMWLTPPLTKDVGTSKKKSTNKSKIDTNRK